MFRDPFQPGLADVAWIGSRMTAAGSPAPSSASSASTSSKGTKLSAGIVPDILLVGKGLSGGVVPVAAVVAIADAYRAISEDPLLHSSTYAGNPLAMSAASAAISALEEDDIIPRAQSLGARLLDELQALKEDHAPTVLADVRGCGLLLAFDFHEDHFAGDFVLELLNRHVIVSTSLNATRVVRLHPAAIMDEGDIEWLLGGMRESADAVEERFGGSGA